MRHQNLRRRGLIDNYDLVFNSSVVEIESDEIVETICRLVEKRQAV